MSDRPTPRPPPQVGCSVCRRVAHADAVSWFGGREIRRYEVTRRTALGRRRAGRAGAEAQAAGSLDDRAWRDPEFRVRKRPPAEEWAACRRGLDPLQLLIRIRALEESPRCPDTKARRPCKALI